MSLELLTAAAAAAAAAPVSGMLLQWGTSADIVGEKGLQYRVSG